MVPIGSCSAGWYGSTMPYRMSAGDRTHSTLWVRPSDIDGDDYSVEEDCDDNDVTVHDSCNQIVQSICGTFFQRSVWFINTCLR